MKTIKDLKPGCKFGIGDTSFYKIVGNEGDTLQLIHRSRVISNSAICFKDIALIRINSGSWKILEKGNQRLMRILPYG